MTDETRLGRRLTDMGAAPDMITLMLEIQAQSLLLRGVKDNVQGLPELTRKVDALVAQMEVISEEVDSIDKIKELVDWHERLWKLISTICILLFPTLLASVFWLWTQLAEIQSKQVLQEYKIQLMEKVNGKTKESTNTDTTVFQFPWNIWHFNNPRVQNSFFSRTAMEKKST